MRSLSTIAQLLGLVLLSFSATAQVEREEGVNPDDQKIKINKWLIAGKVVDEESRKGVEAVSVQLYAWGLSPANPGKDSLVAGTFTRKNGDFSFENFPAADSFRIIVTAVGYTTWEQKLLPPEQPSSITDLGDISIAPNNNVMSNVVVTTQRPALQMGIDRKIFSVDQNITSTGGTALDVMRNVPSVSVDIEGNVQLRNADPQIFVDGRPTVLTLDQIPADQIERVELITNPSSKFDASGSGGIINIVMKRNRRIGINGVASAGVGQPSQLHGNLTLNARQNKINFFVNGGYHQSSGRTKGTTFRENKVSGATDNYFDQYSINDSKRRFRSIRFGLDFFATNRTTLSATQSFFAGNFSNEEEQSQQYLDQYKTLVRNGERLATGDREFNRSGTQLNFQHRFPLQGRELTGFLNYNRGSGNEEAKIENSFFYPDGQPFSDPARVRNEGNNNSQQVTFQVDYKTPFSEEGKVETGIRSYYNNQESYFSSFSRVNGSEILLPLSNNNSFAERVNAAYVSIGNKVNDFSYMFGLRAEVSNFEGELLDSGKKFSYNYPTDINRFADAFFPSLFLTKAIGEDVEMQVNYTRRIRRPNFWQLNPFIDINDPVNLRQGNQQLQPEFINSFEFNYSHNYPKGNFLGVLYYRNNNRDIIRYSDTISTELYNRLNNAAIDPNAILNTFVNARSTNRMGAELTLQHKFSEWLEMVPTVDMQYRQVNAGDINENLSNNGFNWEGKLTLNYKQKSASPLLKDLRLQLMGEYESEEVTAQGRNLAQYRVDFGLRKDFLKDNKLSLSFNVNDVFNSHRFGSIYDTDFFYQESTRRRNPRNFRVTLSYKFGKDDFNLFRRQGEQQRGNDDDM
ncbi:MAG: outer membrane beta-barrel protein [Flavisolibacter sp.]